jgi:transposase
MTERVEQRYCIKFCQKLGDFKAETIQKIQQAFGDHAMSATQIKEWFNRFKDGRTLADSDQRSGRPSTSQNANLIENVRSLILEDRRLTV